MLRIATQNIRQPERGDRWKHRWSIRKQAHAHIFKESRFHLVALQEMVGKTAESFSTAIHKINHNWVITPAIHGNAVMYRTEFIHTAGEPETFEYNVGSEKGNSGFTAYPFIELGTDTLFTFINTHLHGGDRDIRFAQAMQLMEYVDSLTGENSDIVLIGGDFNSLSTVQQVFHANGLVNLWEQDEQQEPAAALNSYQGWTEGDENKYEDEHVDGLFAKGDILVVESGITPSSWNGVQASDHYIVWCDVILNKADEE